jgi:uncharacterized repeat protein (TIGR03803 family)
MKQFIFLLSIIFILQKSEAQPALFGMTATGGQYGGGTIFKTDASGMSQTVIHDFFKYEGQQPLYTHLIEATDGNLYGMTNLGGANSSGVLFGFNPSTGSYSNKFNFGGTNGSKPQGSLVQATDGNLYGMTCEGGANNLGVLFQYNPITNVYTKKIDFSGLVDGSNPSGSLVQASDGVLYGMTRLGGTNSMGVLFSYDPITNVFTKKVDFIGVVNGANPYGSLIQASDGYLYGMTHDGGANSKGVLFSYDPNSNVLSVKSSFNTNGSFPWGSLVQATDGNLYGMTEKGGVSNFGVIFQYNFVTNVYSKKMDFTGGNGQYPWGSLIQANDGNLYGMTRIGGVNSMGVIFGYDPVANSYSKKIDFAGTTNGIAGCGSLMQASDGKLYGLTNDGGTVTMGVLFSYDLVTSVYNKKLDFESGINGFAPFNSLIQISDGNLYGVTKSGGVNGCGVIFQYNPLTNTYTKKIDFSGINGGGSSGSLIQASDGNFYGTTSGYGTNSKGVIFQYNPLTNIYTKKFDFSGTLDGANPYGSLVEANNGNLYGMTYGGGSTNQGVLFSYNPTTNQYTKIIDFNGSLGNSPQGSLIQASDGNLYGLTYVGGTFNGGVLFSLNPTNNSYSKKVNFKATANVDGGFPNGSLIQATDGNLYGMTKTGGINNLGVLFAYNPSTSIYSKKLDFNGAINGSNPRGSLLQASNGNLYGMTYDGGINNFGVLFEYNPLSSSYNKRLDFNAVNGKNPIYNNLNEINSCNLSAVIISSQTNVSCYGGSNGAATISATGNSPFTYTWSPSLGNSANVSGLSAGMYTCVVTNSCGATRSQTLVVTQPASLTLSAVAFNTTSCSGSTNTLTANASGGSAPITYTWAAGSTNSVNIVNPVVTNVYTINVTDANNCTLSQTVAVNINPLPTLTVTGTNTVCLGTSAGFIANGAITYTWNTGQTTTSISVNPTSTTIFTVMGTDMNGCINSETVSVTVNTACADVWPGDANSDGVADNLDVLELGLHYTQTGAPRVATSNSWQSYFANNWTGTISNGKNLNHSDCNGDGIINDDDTLAIYNNYGLTHAFKPAQTTTVNPQLSVVPDQAMVTKGNWGTASIYLGDATTNINNINGVAFTIDFDNTLIEPSNVWIEYQNSFIDASQNLYFRKLDFSNSKLFTASTHTVSNNVSGFGKIATLHYQILSSLATDQVLTIGLSQANQSNASGVITPLTSGTGTLMAIGASVGVKETLINGNVLISPNPTNGLLNISFGAIPSNTKIELYNSIGALVLTEAIANRNNTINVSDLSSGMYFMKVLEGIKVIAVQKVVKE